jgi:RNA polymerase sigma-70 factor (ECF subfamily)
MPGIKGYGPPANESLMPIDRSDDARRDRFERLYVEHYGHIYAFVHRRVTGDTGDVPDIVAEVFAVAWKRIDDVPEAPAERLWLYGVARRSVQHHQRSAWRRLRLVARLTAERAVSPPLDTTTEPLQLRLRGAIEKLRPLDQEVLRLVLWDGLSHAEAATVFSCSVNAIALRLLKAKGRLRQELGIAAPAPPSASPALDNWRK